MIGAILIALAFMQSVSDDAPPWTTASGATEVGSSRVVQQLLDAAVKKSDVDFQRVGRGMAVMLAPDFAYPLDRTKFEKFFAQCTMPHVIATRPFPNEPKAMAVRVEMSCTDAKHPQATQAIADFMADDQHVMLLIPGGVDRLLPDKKTGSGKL